ncbi:hypothetical protein F2P56_011966 [Juglans regia]|uniref:Neurofilament medium polypeptide-like n=2 Tax=Juglans regia TaxID=51240 RepID=A0A2I4GWA0_JUGRE|nr:neurofilament medium polypeptide-like [Juglans regia]KAF5467746.1 hypothetical protein F2P56_011966 [Juglans regia]
MEGLLFTEKTLIVIRVSAMDVEFGLKLTKTMDDLASFADFQLSKGRAGPVFLSREDVNMFILTVHLRGFKKENINIKISEDGTQITVHAEKPVQQTVMIGRMVHKEWTELKVFRKVFKIPDGVVLDLIKAGFKEEGSILTIIMPKQEKGIHGVGVEEVMEEEVGRVTAKSEREVVVADEFAERDKVGVRIKKEYEVPKIKTIEADHVVEKEIDRWGSKKTQTVEDAPRKNLIGERIHWKKPVAEEFPKKEYIGKTLPEKTEEPKVESTEETDRAVKEPLKREKETREPVSKLAEETKHQEVSTIEPMLVEPRNETATPRKELPALIEQRKKQEIPEVEKVEQRGLEEEKSIKDEGRQKIPQEPQRQVSHTDVTDSMKSKPDQELEQAATPQLQYPAEQHGKDEVTEREKTSSIGDEILEASNERSSQEKEGESSEAERQKDLGEGAAQEKKVASTRCKLFAPCVVAGSAILVSFIALVIHSAKRRQVKSA